MKQTELEMSLETDYSRLPDENVLLFGTHTTRYDGFIDMLLSGRLMTSQATHDLLGAVQTRQGTCFGDPETSATRLDYLSFGAGHVSFGYSEPGINQRSFENYKGGLGIFVPVTNLLMKDIFVYQYSRTNLLLDPRIVGRYESLMYDGKDICETIHLARKKGLLSTPDWNLTFELNVAARNGDLPEIDLVSKEVIIALPENLREMVMESIAQRQEAYGQFLTELTSTEGKVVMDRKIKSRDQTIGLLERMVAPFDESRFNIVWYPHKNLQYALLELATTKKGVISEVPLDINEYWEHLQAAQSSF